MDDEETPTPWAGALLATGGFEICVSPSDTPGFVDVDCGQLEVSTVPVAQLELWLELCDAVARFARGPK